MNTYVWVDLLVVAAPILLSFDRKVRFFRRWPAAIASSALVGVFYVSWDSLMTRAGAWWFSDRFAGSARFLGLPMGELLFFLCAPMACIFLYEVIATYVPERWRGPGRPFWLAAAAAFGVAAFMLRSRLYTSTVLGAAGLFLALASLLAPSLLRSRRFWIALAVSYAPFLAANGALTSLPVVLYSPKAILGPRLLSIPLEDFLYNFALLGSAFLVFAALRDPPLVKAGRARPDARDGLSMVRPFQVTRRTKKVSTMDRANTPVKNSR
jgi:lycopene cyclase domain-containing protein